MVGEPPVCPFVEKCSNFNPRTFFSVGRPEDLFTQSCLCSFLAIYLNLYFDNPKKSFLGFFRLFSRRLDAGLGPVRIRKHSVMCVWKQLDLACFVRLREFFLREFRDFLLSSFFRCFFQDVSNLKNF